MRVLSDYGSHHYFHIYSFEKDIYCPNCASKGVWVESEGDYYCGPEHICTSCLFEFTMPTSRIGDARVEKIVEQLKSGITAKPTNPKGN